VSDWSPGRDPVCEEWYAPAAVVVFVGQGALVGFLGGSWVTLAVVLGAEAAAAGLGLVGWLVWPRVQGWRADRALAREDSVLAGNDHYDKRPGES
jgi:hypothetical protein